MAVNSYEPVDNISIGYHDIEQQDEMVDTFLIILHAPIETVTCE